MREHDWFEVVFTLLLLLFFGATMFIIGFWIGAM